MGWSWPPRVNVKWSPSALWDARLNAGRGYRRVHLFTEEHAALDGSRQVLIAEGGLNPESSWNANVSMIRTLGTSSWTGTASVQAFGTLFTDRIYADYDSLPNSILYRNVEGNWMESRAQCRLVAEWNIRVAVFGRGDLVAFGIVRAWCVS